MTSNASTAAPSASNTRIKGILCMLAAVVVFAVMDAAMKHLGQFYPPLQVASLRGGASLPFILLAVAAQNSWRTLIPDRIAIHLLRAVISVAMLGLFVYSVKTLSLASAYAIFLCGPLLVTALSVPLLREHVDWQRWVAILIGLIGVVVMIRPSAADVVTLGALAAFAAALCYALAAILIRVASRTENTLSMTFSFVLLIALLAGALSLRDWVPVEPQHLLWILTMGLTGALGQYFIIEAFRQAPASVVAPFDYTALIWGGLLDFVLWQTLPDSRMMSGATIVVATGLYLIYRERVVSASHAKN